MTKRTRMFIAILASSFMTSAAVAAVPVTSTVEGVLTSAGGGPAADGTYDVTFRLYDGQFSKASVWSEGPVKVTLKGGRFSHALGSVKALNATQLAGMKSPWFELQVSKDPALPRRPLSSVMYAHVAKTLACSGCVTAGQLANNAVSAQKVAFSYAGSVTKGGPASDLACTGCVSVKELKFDGNVDMGTYSLKAKNGTFTGSLVAKEVTAAAFAGDGSKLTGIKIPSGSCTKAGEVVKGINPDGSLKCVVAMDPKGLPANGLDEVSNNLLKNQFTNQVSANNLPLAIPDNQNKEAVSIIKMPDLGRVEGLSLELSLENTDLSKISIRVESPLPNKTTYVICDPCGKKDAKIYKSTVSMGTVIKSGSLKDKLGKFISGDWKMRVKDTGFCIPQAPGNAKYCNTSAKTDGAITQFKIVSETLSFDKVASVGALHTKGGLVLQNKASQPATCDGTIAGYIFFDTKFKSLQVCDGKEWVPLALRLLGTKENPGLSCKDIATRRPGVSDGKFWIDPDSAGPVNAWEAYCDMKGGGWTRVDESTNYAAKVYSESSKYYNFSYAISEAQINALRKISAAAKQSWLCGTKGVGSQNYYRGWNNQSFKQSASGTCWHSNNSSTVSGKGLHTNFAALPLRAWQSVDCGDSSEYCYYNVDHAWFK